jgi:hypothetical protein
MKTIDFIEQNTRTKNRFVVCENPPHTPVLCVTRTTGRGTRRATHAG